ncbi:SPRY domain-containing SOCS box protein 3-like isoform 1-T1 [Synchiropus picturatus]
MSYCQTNLYDTPERAVIMRRGRSGRAPYLAWAETLQEAETIQTPDTDEWDSQVPVQREENGSENDLLHSGWLPDLVSLPGTVPATEEAFSKCERLEDPITPLQVVSQYREDDNGLDWVWDEGNKSSGVFLSCGDQKVSFHSDYSCGTAAVRGTKELAEGQHFWEVKMTSPVYGTDMMIGIGTSDVNLEKLKYSFGSLLGLDEDSWGLSYTGYLQHKGDKVKLTSRFGQGSVIGLHFDTWHGTLTFYKNQYYLGIAVIQQQNKKFFPMICSTAAKSSMKVIRSCYTPTSLQYLCCVKLRQMLPHSPDVLKTLDLPPGLHTRLHFQLGWFFSLSGASEPQEQPVYYIADNQSEDLGWPPSPESTLSACSSPSPCASPIPESVPYECTCELPQLFPCAIHCPPTPPSTNYDGWSSESDDHQCKRGRWA